MIEAFSPVVMYILPGLLRVYSFRQMFTIPLFFKFRLFFSIFNGFYLDFPHKKTAFHCDDFLLKVKGKSINRRILELLKRWVGKFRLGNFPVAVIQINHMLNWIVSLGWKVQPGIPSLASFLLWGSLTWSTVATLEEMDQLQARFDGSQSLPSILQDSRTD